MGEWQLFAEGTVPEWTTPAWYAGRESAPHLEQDAHRGRLELAGRMVRDQVEHGRVASISDLGAGDGGLLWTLRDLRDQFGIPLWGYDLQATNVAVAVDQRGVDVRYGDVVAGQVEFGELSICTEMLEHLVDPHGFVRRVAARSAVLVASSPWTERPGAAYEFHTWCWDVDGYRALLEQAGYEVVRHETTTMFQVIMGVQL